MGDQNKPPDCFGIETPPPEGYEKPSLNESEFMDALSDLVQQTEIGKPPSKPKKKKKINDKGPNGYLDAVYGNDAE